MMSKKFRQSIAFISLLMLSSTAVLAQGVVTRPSAIQQPITVATPTPLPLVKSTVSSVATPDIGQPSLEPFVAGSRGVLVETVDGKTVMDASSNVTFNPASNVKLATAFAVLKTLKPSYRYSTKIYTDGVFNQQTGSIIGNLYVVGNDPSFNYEHGVAIAAALNKMGIRAVNGDLIVSANFTLGYSPSALRSGVLLYNTLDAARRSNAAASAWQTYLQTTRETIQTYPNVVVTGQVSTEELPTNLRLLVTHESSPLKDILKACLSYSNNFVAERLGDTVGGATSVERIVEQEAHIAPEEFLISSSSGLGINRVTPRAMMKLFRALHGELAKYKMSITDILPVAGVDEGTLKNRFTDFRARGSVIGKTGTLPQTDGGVSSLVGQMGTAKGEMLFFVIFNQRGNVNSFRNYQNNLVTYLQNQRGGAMSFSYLPKSFPALLANTKVTTEKTLN
ncbi:MAG: D-alanyl-D-alanine carboxypeptidase [Pyrinomonadaceae bacterium]